MFKVWEITKFRTGEGRALYGRVTSVNKKKGLVTMKALGIGSVHRMKFKNVCRVVEYRDLKEIDNLE